MTDVNARIRFLQNNFLADDGAVLTASGAMASFPVSNVVNPRRWKLWIPPGTFVVTASNKLIYINDGSDKTVQLTEGTYTYATLATHIQTRLNASSTNWTASYATTGVNSFRFRIGRSSGTAILRFTHTTSAAWDMLGYVGVVDTSVGTGTNADEIRCHTYERIHVDFGVAREVTAFALFGRAGELLTIPATATVTIKASNTDNFDAPDLSITVTPDTDAIVRFMDDQADTEYRYWEIKWIDRTNTAGPEAYRISQVYLGDYTTLTTRNVNNGFKPRLVDPSQVETSQNGSETYRTYTKFWAFDNLQIRFLQDDDREALWALWESLGLTTPFIVALDPAERISARPAELVKYVRFTNWDPQHFKYKQYDVAFSMREVI